MAKFDPQKNQRRSIRLKGYNYTQPGAYFVTLVTWHRDCLFGEVRSGDMRLNPFGRLVENEWRRLGVRFQQVVVDESIVMPNHVHGILVIGEPDPADPVGAVKSDSNAVGAGRVVGAGQENSVQSGGHSFAPPQQELPRLIPGSLGAIVGAYKSTTARLINGLRRTPGEPVWQRNFYEHILRDEREWEAIRAYIHNNPFQWELDHENPAPHKATR